MGGKQTKALQRARKRQRRASPMVEGDKTESPKDEKPQQQQQQQQQSQQADSKVSRATGDTVQPLLAKKKNEGSPLQSKCNSDPRSRRTTFSANGRDGSPVEVYALLKQKAKTVKSPADEDDDASEDEELAHTHGARPAQREAPSKHQEEEDQEQDKGCDEATSNSDGATKADRVGGETTEQDGQNDKAEEDEDEENDGAMPEENERADDLPLQLIIDEEAQLCPYSLSDIPPKPDNVPKPEGVTGRFLHEFLAAHVRSPSADSTISSQETTQWPTVDESATTSDVFYNVICPLIHSSRATMATPFESFTAYLKQRFASKEDVNGAIDPDATDLVCHDDDGGAESPVATASVFVCHTWSGRFVDLVHCILDYDIANPNAIYYIDIFSRDIPQRLDAASPSFLPSSLDSFLADSPLENVIAPIETVLVAFAPSLFFSFDCDKPPSELLPAQVGVFGDMRCMWEMIGGVLTRDGEVIIQMPLRHRLKLFEFLRRGDASTSLKPHTARPHSFDPLIFLASRFPSFFDQLVASHRDYHGASSSTATPTTAAKTPVPCPKGVSGPYRDQPWTDPLVYLQAIEHQWSTNYCRRRLKNHLNTFFLQQASHFLSLLALPTGDGADSSQQGHGSSQNSQVSSAGSMHPREDREQVQSKEQSSCEMPERQRPLHDGSPHDAGPVVGKLHIPENKPSQPKKLGPEGEKGSDHGSDRGSGSSDPTLESASRLDVDALSIASVQSPPPVTIEQPLRHQFVLIDVASLPLPSSLAVAQLCIQVGYCLYYDFADGRAALPFYKRALGIQRELLPVHHPVIGDTLYCLGRVCDLAEHFEPSALYYRDLVLLRIACYQASLGQEKQCAPKSVEDLCASLKTMKFVSGNDDELTEYSGPTAVFKRSGSSPSSSSTSEPTKSGSHVLLEGNGEESRKNGKDHERRSATDGAVRDGVLSVESQEVRASLPSPEELRSVLAAKGELVEAVFMLGYILKYARWGNKSKEALSLIKSAAALHVHGDVEKERAVQFVVEAVEKVSISEKVKIKKDKLQRRKQLLRQQAKEEAAESASRDPDCYNDSDPEGTVNHSEESSASPTKSRHQGLGQDLAQDQDQDLDQGIETTCSALLREPCGGRNVNKGANAPNVNMDAEVQEKKEEKNSVDDDEDDNDDDEDLALVDAEFRFKMKQNPCLSPLTRELKSIPYDQLLFELITELGNVLVDDSKHEKGIACFEAAYVLFQDEFSKDILDDRMLGIKYNLGCALGHARKFSRAFALIRDVRWRARERFGSGHPFVLVVTNSLGYIYHLNRKLDIAFRFFQKALVERLRFLGVYHHATTISFNNFGNALYDGSKEPGVSKEEGKELLRKGCLCHRYSEVVAQRILGILHRDSMICSSCIVSDRLEQGKYDLAISTYRTLDKHYGKDLSRAHNLETVADILHTVGIAHWFKVDMENALHFMKLGLDKCIEATEPPSSRIACYQCDYGSALRDADRYEEAIEQYAASCKMYEELEHYEGIALTYRNIADTYKQQGELESALEAYKKSSEMFKKEHEGITHIDVCSSLNKIGIILHDLERYSLSIFYYKQAADLYREYRKTSWHDDVAGIYCNIGVCLRDNGRHSEGLDWFMQAEKIRMALYYSTLEDVWDEQPLIDFEAYPDEDVVLEGHLLVLKSKAAKANALPVSAPMSGTSTTTTTTTTMTTTAHSSSGEDADCMADGNGHGTIGDGRTQNSLVVGNGEADVEAHNETEAQETSKMRKKMRGKKGKKKMKKKLSAGEVDARKQAYERMGSTYIENGRAYYSEAKYSDAIEFYTKALGVFCRYAQCERKRQIFEARSNGKLKKKVKEGEECAEDSEAVLRTTAEEEEEAEEHRKNEGVGESERSSHVDSDDKQKSEARGAEEEESGCSDHGCADEGDDSAELGNTADAPNSKKLSAAKRLIVKLSPQSRKSKKKGASSILASHEPTDGQGDVQCDKAPPSLNSSPPEGDDAPEGASMVMEGKDDGKESSTSANVSEEESAAGPVVADDDDGFDELAKFNSKWKDDTNPHGMATRDIATTLNYMGTSYFEAKQFELCVQQYEKALAIYEYLHRDDHNHSNVQLLRSNLAEGYAELGRYEDVERLNQLIIDEATKSGTDDDERTIVERYRKLGNIYYEVEPSKSLELYKKALEHATAKFGENDATTAQMCSILGNTETALHNYTGALTYFERAARITKAVKGAQHLDTGLAYNAVGIVHYRRREFRPAAERFLQFLTVCQAEGNEGAKNERSQAFGNLGHALCGMEYFDLGLQNLENGLEVLVSLHGPEHADVLDEHGKLVQARQAIITRLRHAMNNAPEGRTVYLTRHH